jgi:aerobic carbon-monoxide dehydrogenase medium subunit
LIRFGPTLASNPEFVVPRGMDEALAALANEGSLLVAGGTSVGVMLKNRLIEPDSLVSLSRVPDLRDITGTPDGGLRIGAMTTLRELFRSSAVHASAELLAVAASKVGNPRIRSLATVGGAVVHGDPRQDLPPVLLALQAEVRIVGPTGERVVPMSEMLLGFMESAVDDDEIITEVVIPPGRDRRGSYLRYTPNSEDDYPTVGVAVCIQLSSNDVVVDAVVALGGVASRAITVPGITDLLVGSQLGDRAIELAAQMAGEATNPSDDQRGSVAYKRSMTEVWTRRALSACVTV